MGKSQSKLSPEQLADLQKNTYCASLLSPPVNAYTPQSIKRSCSSGTRASAKTALPASLTSPSSAKYTGSSSPLAIPQNSLTMSSTSLTRTKTAPSTSRSSSSLSASQAAAVSKKNSDVRHSCLLTLCSDRSSGAFQLYDIDKDGFITYDEMLQIVQSIYKMTGEMVNLPPDEDTPQKVQP